jgi:hypothetical protein
MPDRKCIEQKLNARETKDLYMATKLSDLSIDDLRASLQATEVSAGPNSVSARIIRRELQQKEVAEKARWMVHDKNMRNIMLGNKTILSIIDVLSDRIEALAVRIEALESWKDDEDTAALEASEMNEPGD